jgi:uncharacterized membrane protein YebE (DUF533 family)
MSLQNLLNQVLKAAADTQRTDTGKYATGAAAGSLVTMLLGSKRGRKLGGSALKLGSVAAVGALAWKVYNDYQAKQLAQAPAQAAGAPPSSASPAALPAPATFENLTGPQIELHSQAMLKAMIAAAKADGHLDERERGLVQAELQRLDADPATHRWVEQEMSKPVEPAEVAAAASSPEMAAEIYLASVLVADETSTMERAYLDELARQLKLTPELRAQLDAQASA